MMAKVPFHGRPPKGRELFRNRDCIGAQEGVVAAIVEPGLLLEGMVAEIGVDDNY
jgi:hypothetical protein